MAEQLTNPSGPQSTAAPLDSTLRQILDRLPEGVCFLDLHWRIAYANSTARQISRIQPEHIDSLTHWEIYPETIGTEIETAYYEVMASREERHLEPFFYEPFSVWYSIHLIPLDQGLVLHYRDISEEQRLKRERQESEDRLNLALNAVNGVGTWDWDIPGDLVYANPRFATLYGVPPAQAAAGITIAQFTRNIHPGDLEHVSAAISETVRTGKEFASDYRLVQDDGSIVWVAARGRCDFDAVGNPLRFPGIVIDITRQKQEQEALRASEERYRILTELNPQSLWTADPHGRIVYANHRFLEYLGYDIVPETEDYLRCFDPEDRNRVIQAWTHSVTIGENYEIDARLRRASDGAYRWWHLRALPIRNEEGNIQQWLGVASDVHENRQAEEQLREQFAEIDRQRREVETIYLGSPIGMALYDAKTLCLLRINDRQAEIFRLPPSEAIGKTYDELAAGVPVAHALIRRAAAGEPILNHTLEGTLDRREDEYRYWNINYSPIFAEDGTVHAIASATVETTHQKRAEAALIQSEKLAAVGRLASSIAHEINNPLESVMNLVYIARQHAILPEVQTFLDLADQELRRVSIIANQTLRFHKQATKPQAISCEELYSTVLSIYEARLRNSKITVENRRRAQHPIVCFEGEIRQVLNNFVGNAIDAMPRGGRLLIRSREATDWRTGHHGLVLTIADTGIGIDPKTQSQIFEAFFTTKGIQGTGLGLWISAEIIQRHYGRILTRSRKGEGTVFSIFLPYEITPSPDPTVRLP